MLDQLVNQADATGGDGPRRSAISYWMFDAAMMGISPAVIRLVQPSLDAPLACPNFRRILAFTRNPPCCELELLISHTHKNAESFRVFLCAEIFSK